MIRNPKPAENGEQQVPFVIRQSEKGREVYSVADPSSVFLVRGSMGHLSCDCAEFARDGGCVHVDAVQREPATGNSPDDRSKGDGNSTLLIKRSVSPDGRIDALSVELSCPVAGGHASITTTMGHYTDMRLVDTKGAVERLPVPELDLTQNPHGDCAPDCAQPKPDPRATSRKRADKGARGHNEDNGDKSERKRS